MANSWASLDLTWAHLPAPAPAQWSHACSWLNPGAAFENEALTSALRASMMPPAVAAAAAASCLSSPATPSSSTSSASGTLSSGLDASAPTTPASSGRAALARPARGRVAKRKPRPSRRAQTTYITAEPADFRRMVQEVTGFSVPGASCATATASAYVAPMWTAPPACVLPTLDTSASFLLDHAATLPPMDRRPTGGASASVAVDRDEDSSVVLQELEAMMRAPAGASGGFPTLESCGIII